MTVKVVHMSNKTLVPDKLYGYLLQVIHMLYELISVDDRVVSVEKLDDVAVGIDRKVIAEQLKSVTSANNPITDRASVFWKTIYNWCTYIEDASLPPNAILRFVVVSNSTVTPGGIQKTFMNAHTDDEAQRALKYAIVALTITFYFQIGYANQNTGEERLLTAGSGEESLLHPVSF